MANPPQPTKPTNQKRSLVLYLFLPQVEYDDTRSISHFQQRAEVVTTATQAKLIK
jgi:hypothetical protein